MSATNEIMDLMIHLQQADRRVKQLNKKYKLEKIFPGDYDDILEFIHGATSHLASFWIAFHTPEDEDL